MIYLILFFEFFKIGLLAIGGGLATIPFLYDLSAKTGWFTVQQLTDMIAIAESTPGPIGINMATNAGFTVAGILGGIVATLGIVAPSFIVIMIVAKILDRFRESFVVQSIFYGLRPASVALIAAAGVTVAKLALLTLDKWNITGVIADLFNFKSILLAAAVFVMIKIFKGHPILYILLSAVVGIVFQFAQ